MFDVIPITSARPTDCGATCLAMLLNYYGMEANLDELVRECRTGLAGCSAKDVLRVGRAHGLDMMAWKADAKDVLEDDRPSIVWWMYNHFVVCCGLDDDGKVVICNPDKGRYRMSVGTFKSFYTGIAMTNGDSQADHQPDGEAK